MASQTKKKKSGVEITMITASCKRFIWSLGDAAFDHYSVAVMDPKPWIGRHKKSYVRVEYHRTNVRKNSLFHKEAMANSAAGVINWRQAGLLNTKGEEFPWDLSTLIRIKQELQYAVVE